MQFYKYMKKSVWVIIICSDLICIDFKKTWTTDLPEFYQKFMNENTNIVVCPFPYSDAKKFFGSD